MVLSALLVPFLMAAPAPQDPGPPPTPFELLLAEHDASELGYAERYQAFRPRFAALVERAPDRESVLRARLWLFGQAWWERQEGTMGATAAAQLDRILADWPRSKRLAEVFDAAFVLAAEERLPTFRRILELTPHPEVKAAALLAIGIEASRSREPEVLDGAKAALKRLAKEFGGLPYKASSYAAMAHAYLNPHPPEALAVGQTAPEILGADLDGEPLALSGFRGKVVVLDFWGDW